MRSPLPKALMPLCGKPMLWHVLRKALSLKAKKTVVVAGFRADLVKRLVGRSAEVIRQKRLLGSGHAVSAAYGALKGFKGRVLVLYCDTPLVSRRSMETLLGRHTNGSGVTLLSARLEDPAGYGRIRRSGTGAVEGIVEEKDASEAQRGLNEVNVGAYVFDSQKLFAALKSVSLNPLKKEYYLTDAVGILAREGLAEAVPAPGGAEESLGVNTRLDLAKLGMRMQDEVLKEFSEQGVVIRDPRTTVIDAGVRIGEGTVVQPSTVIEEDSVIGKGCVIGPFARIRGASRIGDRSVIGNFVEVVRSVIGPDTIIKHLSYIGDARIGRGVNIGAGTITANFDGKTKHVTVIKDKASLGSGTVLIAPVTVGRGAKTGAGAVVPKRQNIPDGGVVAGVPAKILKKARGKRKGGRE